MTGKRADASSAATTRSHKVPIEVGSCVSKEVDFNAADISAQAISTGDTNPLHHDARYAATTRFGGIIASGAHISALLLSMLGGYFADKGLHVGLEFILRFRG